MTRPSFCHAASTVSNLQIHFDQGNSKVLFDCPFCNEPHLAPKDGFKSFNFFSKFHSKPDIKIKRGGLIGKLKSYLTIITVNIQDLKNRIPLS